MEKIECKSCSAVVDKSIEFCSSCGDWLGLSLQDMEKENSNQEEKIQRTTRVPEQLLNKPYLHMVPPRCLPEKRCLE